jgi:ABC-2 type transport system ATP-binding protein
MPVAQMITVTHLCKSYRVHEREGGLAGSIRALVKRRYRDVEAVRDVCFKIAAGEIVGFLGPNGAGKTTTLKMLAGLLYPTSGTIDVAGFTPKERDPSFLSSITMVLGQKQQLIWDLPPEDTFLLNKEIFGVADADYRERLGRLEAMLGLGPLMRRQARKLSLGERMKCELAAALLHGPRVLFLDEPTIGLDVNMQEALRRFIAEYNRETGATILLTSHYMADVTALCKRVLVISEGQLIFDGDLKEIVERMALEKSLTLHLHEPVPAERLAGYGRVVSHEGLEAELAVARPEIAGTAERVLRDLPVADIAILDPPIERVIGSFMTGKEPAS